MHSTIDYRNLHFKLSGCIPCRILVYYVCMKTATHLYVSRKNVLTWLMALCMVASAVARIAFPGLKGSGDSLQLWSQIILPIAATTLYALITLFSGEEFFYKTAIPVWMMVIYSGLWIAANVESRMMVWLFWIALIFFALMYTDITAGHRPKGILLLLPVVASPLGFILYFCKQGLLAGNFQDLLPFSGDILMLVGVILLVFAIRVHPAGEYHPTWGDRIDGRRIRTLHPMDQITAYFQWERNICSNLFEESFEISHVERYIRQKRREGLTDFGITHVLLAAYVRGVAKYPQLNRFISGQKVYSRGEDIQYCMVIKKEMTVDSPDTSIKVHLTPCVDPQYQFLTGDRMVKGVIQIIFSLSQRAKGQLCAGGGAQGGEKCFAFQKRGNGFRMDHRATPSCFRMFR